MDDHSTDVDPKDERQIQTTSVDVKLEVDIDDDDVRSNGARTETATKSTKIVEKEDTVKGI